MMILTSTLLLSSLSCPIAQEPIDVSSKLRGDLATALVDAGGELVPVTIVMTDQVPREEMDNARTITPKAERRVVVTSMLRALAETTQAELLVELEALEAEGHVGRIQPLWIANVIGAEVDAEAAFAIAERADVAWINHDAPRGEEVLAVQPQPASPAPVPELECGVELMRADEVWSTYGIEGEGVVVGVIDTGVCLTHPDIQNQIWRNPGEIPGNGIDDEGNGFVDDVNGWNFESNNKNVNDTQGHGSHVAGTVAGDGTQGTQCGMAPRCDVMVLKFFNSFSGEASVWNSMQYGTANGADVLTASLGWPHNLSPDRVTWRRICENSIAAGVIVVYAAHNYGCSNPPDDVTTPADVPTVIAVGATDCSDFKAGFSSCGPSTWQDVPEYGDWPYPPGLRRPTISAPGDPTKSHSFCNGYTNKSGTSMSTPHVAGAIALILQADPTLDQLGVTAILEASAVDIPPSGPDNQTGAGRVDAFVAVELALANGNFCDAKVNSCGTTPSVGLTGESSASSTSGFLVTGSNAPGNELGILLYTDAGGTFPPLPFYGGELCVKSPIRRGPAVNAGGTNGLCDGTFSLDMNTFASGGAGGSPAGYLLVPGTRVDVQWWGRDSGDPQGVYLTQSIHYAVSP